MVSPPYHHSFSIACWVYCYSQQRCRSFPSRHVIRFGFASGAAGCTVVRCKHRLLVRTHRRSWRHINHPLLLYRRWADPKSAAAVSAVFILINSMVALVGHLESAACLPVGLPFFAVAVVIGRGIGSQLGSVYLSAKAIYRILGAVMFIAGGYKTHFCLNCRINAKPVRFIDCFTP